jgi:hypothetical protein
MQRIRAIEVVPVLDRDTVGTTGSPDIAQTIFNKIATSSAFVADVSIVTGVKRKGKRRSPNPNVLIELGYAVGKLGWHRVILVANTKFGPIEDLPFDIRARRCIGYEALESDPEKAPARKLLSGVLETRLRECIQEDAASRPADPSAQNGSVAAGVEAVATLLQSKSLNFRGQAYPMTDIFRVLVPALAIGTNEAHAEHRCRQAFGFPQDYKKREKGEPDLAAILAPLVIYDVIQERPPQDGYDALLYLTPLGPQLARILDINDVRSAG